MKYKEIKKKKIDIKLKKKLGGTITFKGTKWVDMGEVRLQGDAIESFERVSEISEIILLGKDGEIRRIILR